MKLFGTAGIRLRYPEELDPVLAYKIGLAAAALGVSRLAYVVHDSRTTSPLLSLSVAAGLMAGGVDVGLVGLAPTPVAGFAAREGRALGISVTASHNPPEYNGIKLYDPGGYEFTRDLERKVEEGVESARPLGWSSAGTYFTEPRLVDEYVERLYALAQPRKREWSPLVVVDAGNGAGGGVTPRLLRMVGCRPVTVNANPDGFFPFRAPEPRKDVLEAALPLYSALSPAAIFAHDGDADRLAVLDPASGFIKQDRVIAFLMSELLEGETGVVVVSVDTGRVVDDVAERLGLRVERYMLGKTHERVKELGGAALLAAEPWKLIYPKWGPWVDGVLQAAVLAKAIVESGKPLAKLMEERGIREYPWDRRSFRVEPRGAIGAALGAALEEFGSAAGEPVKVVEIDGKRFEYEDGSWILFRASGTEPKLRIYAEAPRRERLKLLVEAAERAVKRGVERAGGRIVEVTVG